MDKSNFYLQDSQQQQESAGATATLQTDTNAPRRSSRLKKSVQTASQRASKNSVKNIVSKNIPKVPKIAKNSEKSIKNVTNSSSIKETNKIKSRKRKNSISATVEPKQAKKESKKELKKEPTKKSPSLMGNSTSLPTVDSRDSETSPSFQEIPSSDQENRPRTRNRGKR